MNPFLSDYIFSIATRSREKVQSILTATQTSKENLDEISKRINDSISRSPISIRPESYGGVISNANLDAVHRDVSLRTQELFTESNLISLLLDTHSEILSSEVKKQKDQLDSFRKYIDNYTFMLADEGFYDHAYMESFNDEIQKEVGSTLNTMLYDRSGVSFDPTSEILEVDQGAGILAFSSSYIFSHPLSASVIRSNCSPSLVSDTGIWRAVTSSQGEGWRAEVSSQRPIVSSLRDDLDKGAQFEIELFLLSPGPCDTISLSPMADVAMDILSIRVYNEDFSEWKEIIGEKKKLSKETVFFFDQQVVSKFVILVSQSLYTRGKVPARNSEIQYDKALESQRLEFKFGDPVSKENSRKAFSRLFTKWFLGSEKDRAAIRKPFTRLDKYSPAGQNLKTSLSYEKQADYVFSTFKFRDGRRNIFNKWIADKLFAGQPELLERFSDRDSRGYKKKVPSVPPILVTEDPMGFTGSPMNYEYVLGIRNIKTGVTINKNRGVFISKHIPSPVQSGEVRLQADHKNYQYSNSYLANPQITTIEYSVTNKSNPSLESDWVPILPAFEKGLEINERIFLQSSGYAPLRFKCLRNNGVNVYKNGEQVDDISIVTSDDDLSIIGVRIPSSSFSLNPDDVYTATYLPEGDPTTVNFGDNGFQQKNIASSYDDNGAGELFHRTGNSNTVTLKNSSYVDFVKLEKESSYSPSFGLIGSYQPIKVLLADGTVAYNYTNYTGIRQNVLSPSDDKLSFIHSGKKLVFNKQIDQDFRVYYQYEPSYIRYRVIFRVNAKATISPFVNSLTIKMKLNSSVLGMNNKKV